MSDFTPTRPISLGLIQGVIQELNKAIEDKGYQDEIIFSSLAINQLLGSLLPGLFNIRSHAYAMQGQPDMAIVDAENMAACGPKQQVAACLRKGNILSLYGHQIQAIQVYDEFLPSPSISILQHEYLTWAKLEATTINGSCVDFIGKLPTSVAHSIISQLPQETKATCLTVSRKWRQLTFECEAVWGHLLINENEKDMQLMNAAQYVGDCIEHLTINVATEAARSACIKVLKDGHFTNLKSLKMTALTTRNLWPYIGALSVAFWQARSTLTTIKLDLGNNQHTITLADTLLTCTSVTDLSFKTTSPMATLGGDFLLLSDHHPLSNLELKSSSITGSDIEAMLQRCQKLRRLVMNGCDTTVLDMVNQHTPNLEILGYNHDYETQQLQSTINTRPGLRRIYTNDGGAPVPAAKVIPLIYKNMQTLEAVYVHLSEVSKRELQEFSAIYPNLKLESLSRLSFWSTRGTQQLILQSIHETRTLTHLDVVNVHDLDRLIGVIMAMPPLTKFQVSYVKSSKCSTSFIQLFQRYATMSLTQHSLTAATFRYCGAITDAVLDSMANITTLKQIFFCNLDNITTRGIIKFFDKVKDQLTDVKLAEMDAITDSSVVALGQVRTLACIELERLFKVTNTGIRAIVEKGNGKLKKLTVTACPLVSKNCVTSNYVKKHVKAVHYE
ncbi:hypothetical protein BJV82DRAFT_250745 [Fennellomyces sp. T-0311]|nr:hypothetical protein BJV82DRAFT_250745 [Fennellomyces sp. T-0311]